MKKVAINYNYLRIVDLHESEFLNARLTIQSVIKGDRIVEKSDYPIVAYFRLMIFIQGSNAFKIVG